MTPPSLRSLTSMAITAAIAVGVLLAATPPVSAAATARGVPVRLDTRFADAAGTRTAFAILGPQSGLPLLLLNGTGSPMSQWDPALLAALSRSRRVIVYDYPGLGATASLDGRLTFDRLAAHAASLLTAIGVDRADVLGWSMGGFVAQRLAVRSPQRVHALVLAATNPGGQRSVLGPAWVQREDSDAGSTARGYVRTNYPPGARGRGWAFVHRVNAAIDAGRFPPDIVPVRTYDAMVAAEDPWLASGANLAQLPGLTMPVLVVTGAQDVVTPPANTRVIAGAIPGSRLELVHGAGHSFLFQAPYRMARDVGAFLDQAEISPGR